MNKSESITELAKAMSKFQTKVGTVKFDSVNPVYKRKFASLTQVIETIKEVAPALGLSWSQLAVSDAEGRIGIETIVIHDSGEWISGTVYTELPTTFMTREGEKPTNLIQEAGKNLTYLRRYGLSAAFGLSADEDTDGNAPTSRPQTRTQTTTQPKAQNTTSSKKTSERPVANPRPYNPALLVENLRKMAKISEPATSRDVSLLVAALSQYCKGDEDLRHDIQQFLFGVPSSKDIDLRDVSAGLAWLKPSWSREDKSYAYESNALIELDLVMDELNG